MGTWGFHAKLSLFWGILTEDFGVFQFPGESGDDQGSNSGWTQLRGHTFGLSVPGSPSPPWKSDLEIGALLQSPEFSACVGESWGAAPLGVMVGSRGRGSRDAPKGVQLQTDGQSDQVVSPGSTHTPQAQ